ncbi:MAG: asparagine synthase-related protein, partial [Bradymonadaceae bacterium]
ARNFFFEGVERLRPREYLTRRAGDASGEVGRYWSVDVDPLPEDVDPARRLRRRLEEVLEQETAPRVHAVSGGIDSSALATVDSERYEGVTDPEILRALDRRLEIDRRTFCLDGRLPLTDPAIYRRQLAWGPHHHVDEQWLAPFFEETRRRTGRQTIAVGLGGDRIWRGRPGLSVHDALAGRRWRALGRFGRRLPSRQFVKLLAGRGVALSGSRRLVELKQAVAGGGERPVWRRPDLWVNAVDGWRGVRRSLGDLAGRGPARRALVADRDGWPWELVGLALHRHRCRSGVRLACPLLDPSIWTLGLRIPPDRHYGDGEQKAVLRESVRDLLPEEVVDAPKHGLFDEVVEDALGRRRRHLVVELFDDPLLAETGLLEPDRFREVFDRYCRAIARRSEPLYGSLRIWRTIAAELWLRALRC